jgi:hypothetical protein
VRWLIPLTSAARLQNLPRQWMPGAGARLTGSGIGILDKLMRGKCPANASQARGGRFNADQLGIQRSN